VAANTTIESVLRGLLSNPDAGVKAFMVMALQFAVGVAFGYFAVRALKYILALVSLIMLLTYATPLIAPIAISVSDLIEIAEKLLPLFVVSTGPFLVGVVVGSAIGLLRR
jgi:hypothetical protein